MQATTSSLLCSQTLPHSHHPFAAPFRSGFSRPVLPSSAGKLSFKPIQFRAVSPLHSTATEETVETANSGLEFVEVGYISSVHGLQGEICVKPSTDFPELRFSQPGRRWLQQTILGKKIIQEVQLVEGRGRPGQKSWILRLEGIDMVDQARQLVGSTLLVRADDRPDLDEGEFYTRDLVGMRVILKETGECVGAVVNVFDSGGNDLLQVLLNPSVAMPDATVETGGSGSLVWIPFVEAIVPDVDMIKREMWITPPKGLLQLNLRIHEKSKKERRQLEWKERRKAQRHLIAAKKKLGEMEQKHVLDGLRYGEKSQRSLLADEIVGVNSKLLQQALENIDTPSKRWTVAELISVTRAKLIKSSIKISKEYLTSSATKEKLGTNFKLQEKGTRLISKGKAAIILVVNDIEKRGEGDNPDIVSYESNESPPFFFLQRSLSDDRTFVKVEDRVSVPLVLVCPVQEVESLKGLFENNDYFGFDSNKVWFLEEEKLPVVNSSIEELKRHKILMKSPWEILQSPVGSGGVISLLASNNILENLGEIGVEYIKVCSANQMQIAGNSLLLGFVHSSKADLGIQIFENAEDLEESFDMIFAMDFMKNLVKHIDQLQFYAIPKSNSHVELVENEWIEIVSSSPNSYELHSSIYSSLNACPHDKLCVLEITE